MPVTIDMETQVDPSDHDLENGVDLVLDDAARGQVVMTKFITTNPNRYGFRPEGEWIDQVTTDVGGGKKSARILTTGLDGQPRSVNIDDGLIIDMVGTLTRVVGLLPGRPPLDESEIDLYIEQTDEPVPLFQQWDFRVTRVRKTNGPEGRLSLTRSEEQKRLKAQTEMLDTQAEMMEAFRQMFSAGAQQLNSDGELAPKAQAALNDGVKALKKG